MVNEQENTLQQEVDSFHKNSGEILRLALGIESCLDFFISNYFCRPQTYKTFLFSDLILVGCLSFERKTQIFKEICEQEGIDKSTMKDISSAVNFVKNIRNMVAHGEAFMNGPEGLILQKRKSKTYKKDELKITDDLVSKVDEKRLFSIREINKILVNILGKNEKDRNNSF